MKIPYYKFVNNFMILGWALGRLPDGTEGVYPSEYVEMV